MADLALIWRDGKADIDISETDVLVESTLITEVLVSLFSDARHESERGWWSREMGSLLWLLDRNKRTPEVLQKARKWAEDSLLWLIEKQIASDVTVNGRLIDPAGIALEIIITRSGAKKYEHLWEDIQNATRVFNKDTFTIQFLK